MQCVENYLVNCELISNFKTYPRFWLANVNLQTITTCWILLHMSHKRICVVKIGDTSNIILIAE